MPDIVQPALTAAQIRAIMKEVVDDALTDDNLKDALLALQSATDRVVTQTESLQSWTGCYSDFMRTVLPAGGGIVRPAARSAVT